MDLVDSGTHLMALGDHCILFVMLWLMRPVLGMLGDHQGATACHVRCLLYLDVRPGQSCVHPGWGHVSIGTTVWVLVHASMLVLCMGLYTVFYNQQYPIVQIWIKLIWKIRAIILTYPSFAGEATIKIHLKLNNFTSTGVIKDEIQMSKTSSVQMSWVDPVRGYAAELTYPYPRDFFNK